MRTRSLMMAAPVLATIAMLSGSARADDAPETDSNLPQLPPPSTPASAPASPPAASAPPSTSAATPGPRVVVVQTPNGPTRFQLAEPKKFKRVWYGWQTLTLDGVAIASGAILAKGDFDGAGWVWIGTYAFGPPVVHALHGRIGIAFADLGIRVGAPVVTTLIGGAIGCSGSNSGDDGFGDAAACATGLVLGFLVGYAGAIAVDAAVLAREKVEVDPQSDEAKEMERERRKRASTFSIAPDMGLGQNRATLGVHGQF